MQKTKIYLGILGATMAILIEANTVFASPSVLSIQALPTYENTNNFKISCTTNGTNAQFYYSKNGGSWTAFGPLINVTTNTGGCIIQLDSSVINDQTLYNFKVNVDGTDSTTTSTTFDNSGPSPVSGYYKERINDGLYKLHFHTPSDGDFDSVIIYRGDSADFSADSAHKIAQVSGGANSDMTYDDNFTPDPSKTYFYDIRAIDRAGNSSSLVGDNATTTTTVSATPSGIAGVLGSKAAAGVISLPKEPGVLGTEATASPNVNPTIAPTPVATQNIFTWIKGHKKISLGVAFVLILLGYGFYNFTKKK